MSADELHQALRDCRNTLATNHAVRLHRAISWMHCAEAYSKSDDDVALIALWISFNACYAIDDHREHHDARDDFNDFASKLCNADTEKRIHELLWSKYSQFVRLLIDNKYIFSPFWASVRGANIDWEQKFSLSKKRAFSALANNETPILLSIILDRLYVLRNQLLHGGATYQSSLNRDQVKDGKNLLLEILPLCLQLMMDNADVEWGKIYYPVTE